MYWNPEEAIKELKRRQKDLDLVRKVDEFLRASCPIPNGFNGFLARHIATARLEDVQFEQKCKELSLCPITLEYLEDIFVPENPSKKRLVVLYVFEGYGKKGGPRLKKLVLADVEKYKGEPLKNIQTKKEELLLWKFHHRARDVIGLKGKVIDISNWLMEKGKAKEYYPYLFTATLTRGILFESFESPGFPDLLKFKEEVVIPAWEFVVQKFGMRPLIVYHPENEDEKEENILNWYPVEVLKGL